MTGESPVPESPSVYRQRITAPIRPVRRARRATVKWAGDRLLGAASKLGRLHPVADPRRHDIELLRDIPYRTSGSADHTLDIYRPKGVAGPLPVVLYIHGGAFRILSKDTHWMMGLMFASRGYVMASINYRLAPVHKFPAAVNDAGAAYEWVVRTIADYGGDPSRIILAGESAGANLVTALTVMTTFERPEPWARGVFDTGVTPQATLPACGILQVSDTQRFLRRKRLARLVFEQIEACETAYLHGAPITAGGTDLADPLLVLESNAEPVRELPPFFAFVGTRDPLLDDTRRLGRALSRRGVAVDTRYYPGVPHAFHAVPILPTARRCWDDMFGFMDLVLDDGTAATSTRARRSLTLPMPRDHDTVLDDWYA